MRGILVGMAVWMFAVPSALPQVFLDPLPKPETNSVRKKASVGKTAFPIPEVVPTEAVIPVPIGTAIPGQTAVMTPPMPTPARTQAAPTVTAPSSSGASRAGKTAVRGKRAVEIYGYIKLDASVDNGIDPGNFARYAKSGVRDSQSCMTAKESRLGLSFLREGNAGKVSGKVEIDFCGTGGDENKGLPMMRHAYMELSSPSRKRSLLAGQSSDVIAPLNPASINYTVYWYAGNIGYRRPQVRFTQASGSGNTSLTAQVAVCRTIGESAAFVLASPAAVTFVDASSGEDSGYPTVEGRIALATGAPSGANLALGIYAQLGQEQFDPFGDFMTSCVGGDLTFVPLRKVEIKSEAWKGRNLDAFLGGIGQGMNLKNTKIGEAPLKEIHAQGGWVAVVLGPFGRVKCYGGAGVDDPTDKDLNGKNRSRNQAAWSGVSVNVESATRVAVEYSYFDTRYLDAPMGFSHRGQVSLIYDF